MPGVIFSEVIIDALKVMKAFPIFMALFICVVVVLIGLFIKNLLKEHNPEERIKKVIYALLFAICSPVACYMLVMIFYPFFS